MTPFNINGFIGQFTGDGYRPNLFDIFVTGPVFPSETRYKAKATSVPSSSIGSARVSYFGRAAKLAGNRRYNTHDITFIMDEDDFQLVGTRGAFQSWMNKINKHEGNYRELTQPSTAGYMGTINIFPYKKNQASITQYSLQYAFPISISPIVLDWGQNDRIAEFTVTFAYQYWIQLSAG